LLNFKKVYINIELSWDSSLFKKQEMGIPETYHTMISLGTGFGTCVGLAIGLNLGIQNVRNPSHPVVWIREPILRQVSGLSVLSLAIMATNVSGLCESPCLEFVCAFLTAVCFGELVGDCSTLVLFSK